ncbi:MAG: flippase [Clostridia bacterium]|nr:flippase [Clostridia bacterium]
MSKKSVSINYFYNLFYQILVIVLPLITTPYLSRTLGAEAIGTYSFTLSIVTYFVLFGSLGVAIYGQREIAYVQDNKKSKTSIFWEIFLLRLITMVISMIIYYLIYGIKGNYVIYYRILIIELINQAVDISWFFQGLEEFKKTVIRNSAVKLLFVASVFLFIKTPNDLIKYILIVSLANLFGNVSLWLYLPKYLNKIKLKELNIIKHFKPIIILFIPQIAIQLYTVMDRTMIGMICPDIEEVGFYEQAQKIVKLLLTIVTSLGTVMIPRMAHTLSKDDQFMVKEYIKKSFSFVVFLAFPICVGICLIAKEFVPIFFGEGYDQVIILIQVISPIILFIGISNLIGNQYLLPARKQKEFTISVTCGAVVNMILNYFLIKEFAAMGASIATVIAEFVVVAIQSYYIYKIINIKEIFDIARNNIIATIVMFFVVVILNKIVGLTEIACVVFKTVIGVLSYIGMLFLLKDEFVNTLVDKVLTFLHIKNKLNKI